MEGGRGWKGWLAGLTAAVIGGLLVVVLTPPLLDLISNDDDDDDGTTTVPTTDGTATTDSSNSTATTEPPTTTTEVGLLQALEGDWVLDEWNEVGDAIEFGFDLTEGTLVVEPDGRARWVVVIEDRFGPEGNLDSIITCQGRVLVSGEMGATDVIDVRDPTSRMTENSLEINLAFCGQNVLETESFQLAAEIAGGEATRLEMTSSQGTYFWER
ncbi:MAG: hypothetical protein ACRD29_24110 [Acidimicrobiales bacterium]